MNCPLFSDRMRNLQVISVKKSACLLFDLYFISYDWNLVVPSLPLAPLPKSFPPRGGCHHSTSCVASLMISMLSWKGPLGSYPMEQSDEVGGGWGSGA
jgi:hypothetical protein